MADPLTAGQTLTVPNETKLDDIMLAMDVVDTLRHEKLLLEKDLTADERRQDLINRLRDIYSAQGIDVPDDILAEGVDALEDQRFSYTPPRPGFSTALAQLYINSRRWLPLFSTVLCIVISVYTINYLGFVRPQQLEIRQTERLLTQELPQQLKSAYQKSVDLAVEQPAKHRAQALYTQGQDALQNQAIKEAKSAIDNLNLLAADLAQTYTIRIVSRPDEYSGVFRIHDDENIRNYYLIVEGIKPDGETASVHIISEEDQKADRVTIWGIRVSETVFNAVAADKSDDQIIQNADIGEKKRGYLTPNYSIETLGGQIMDW